LSVILSAANVCLLSAALIRHPEHNAYLSSFAALRISGLDTQIARSTDPSLRSG